MSIGLWPLLFAAFAAGFIDAIAGGGGLIQLPAVWLAFPNWGFPLVAGTNKCSSIFGTLAAIPQFARKVRFERKVLWYALTTALVLSYCGARAVAALDSDGSAKKLLRPLVMVLLIAVAVYTYTKKNFGEANAAHVKGDDHYVRAGLISGPIGFYDGFFGPGTGSFLIYAQIRWMGFDFLTATAYAKAINAATNLGALLFFIPNGNVDFGVALPMAVCNIAGGMLGARTAILRGNKFVRVLFLIMIAGIIARLGYDVVKQAIGAGG